MTLTLEENLYRCLFFILSFSIAARNILSMPTPKCPITNASVHNRTLLFLNTYTLSARYNCGTHFACSSVKANMKMDRKEQNAFYSTLEKSCPQTDNNIIPYLNLSGVYWGHLKKVLTESSMHRLTLFSESGGVI